MSDMNFVEKNEKEQIQNISKKKEIVTSKDARQKRRHKK